ncbi:MAG: glutathione ABC transporter permease GsiC [Zetaproteobacteria bacterium]|nr:glutathione ABC transporter permease GsiC [Pseudobdellovibrionaceae bacterium]
MLSYLLKRIIAVVPIAFSVIIIISLMTYIIPGDPVDQLLGDFATLAQKNFLRSQLGLDRSVFSQISHYLYSILGGDFGTSLFYNKSVQELIGERIFPTIELALYSILLAIFISIPLGSLGAKNKGTIIDHVTSFLSLAGVAIPNFWLGPLLILLFSVHLELLPVSGRESWDSYILPVLTLGTALCAVLTRVTRNSFLENMHENYIRTARSKGQTELIIMFKHIFKNACLPIITVLGLQFGVLLTGAVITEKIFDWPGLGTLFIDALSNRDYPLIQACILFFSIIYLCVNLMVDLSYTCLDPRIDLESKK